MGLFAIVLVWPFVALAVGIALLAFSDVTGGVWSFAGLFYFILFLLIALIFLRRKTQKEKARMDNLQQADYLRRAVVIMSIALLLPIFIRYLFKAFEFNLAIVVFGLLLGFLLTVSGFFIKGNTALVYSNVIGGGISLVYVYSQLWELGDAARIVAAGFGLVIAVTVATVKLKDKLT